MNENNQNNDNLLNENNQNNDNLLNEHILDEPMSDDTIVDIDLNDTISSTTSSEQCAICLDTIVKENECINNCGHKFCKPCLDIYLDSGKTECPLCRQPIQYFEHNSEHFRLILKKVNERNNIANQRILHQNQLVIDRRKYHIYRFIFIAFFISNIMDMFMSNIYNVQNNLLLDKYNDCEKNNSALHNRLEELNDNYLNDDSESYGFYLIIDKLRGFQTECYLPTNLINRCFNVF